MPLARFIDCICDDNLYALVISGEPALTDLAQAWNDILKEYSHKSGNMEYLTWLRLFKDLHTVQANISLAEDSVRILWRYYVKKFADRLNDVLNQNLAFDITNLEQYDKNINVSWNKIAGLRLQRDIMMTKFQAINEKHADNKPVTKEYYLSLLITLSDNVGYPISDNITVFEFCERIDRANKSAQALKSTHGR